MSIKINWMGMECTANYEVENGENIVSSVEIGDESFDMYNASMAVNDEIHALVDSAVSGYVDNTNYFGEQI